MKVENTATDSNAEKLSNVAFKAVLYMFLSRTICVDFSQCRLGECAIHRPITIGNTMICSYFWHLYYYNFEISLVVFMPNITTNNAITYTNTTRVIFRNGYT